MVRIIICSLLHSPIAGHTLPVADHNQEEVAVHNPFEVVVRILEAVAHILEAADHSPSGVARSPFVVAVRIPFVAAVHIPSEVVRILEVAVHSPSGVVGRILTADRILQLEAVGRRSLLGIFLELPVFPACSSGTVAVS